MKIDPNLIVMKLLLADNKLSLASLAGSQSNRWKVLLAAE